MRDCIKRIVEKTGISTKDAKQLTRSVEREAKRRVDDGVDYDVAVAEITKERVATIEANIKKEKANMARNILIKKQIESKIQDFIDGGLSIADAFRAEFEGIERPIKGAKASVNAQKHATKSVYLTELTGKLIRANLMDIFAKNQLSDEVGENLFRLSGKRAADYGSPQARQMAEIIHGVRDGQRLDANGEGADIGEVSGYVMPQRHDLAEMRRAGQDEWVAFMVKLVNPRRTFGGDYEDLGDALRSAYDAMVSGVRLTDPFEKNDKLFQFSGPADLAKRMSRSREIHFKDYESFKKWNDTYGMKSLYEGIVESIAHDAENIALLRRGGTNTEAMYKAVAERIIKANRGKMKAKSGDQEFIQTMINGMMEKHKIPADATLASVGNAIRAYQGTTKLGGAGIPALFLDPVFSALTYMHNGKNFLSATAKGFGDIAYGFTNKADREKFSSMVGVYSETFVGSIGGRFVDADVTGKSAKVMRLMMRLNTTAWQTDVKKAAFARTMAHELGLVADLPFDKLDNDLSRVLGNYRIDAKDWDTMRASVYKHEDGRNYILSEKIEDKKVAEKLVMYILDQQQSAVITPTAREKRIVSWGNRQSGTWGGEAARMIMQFKSFPISIGTKVLGRAWYGKGRPDVEALVYLAITSGIMGYVSGAARDITKGKTPKDPTKYATVLAAFAQGGGFGILGDLMLADTDGFGRGLSAIAAGPTIGGTAEDFHKIYSAGLRGGGSARQAANFAVGSVPFNNLFYTRAALDQLILLQMQEELNPGYLRRMERNMKKTYGQELLYK